MTNHTCHWPGCTREVAPRLWGCRDHWFRLPKALRDRIWATYVPGQETAKTPSADYIAAARAVQDWIAAQAAATSTIDGMLAEARRPRHALTIWQPWASMIVRGLKPFEFRRYPAPRRYQGHRVVIHAGKRAPDDAECRAVRLRPHRTCGKALSAEERADLLELVGGPFALAALPRSAGVGVVTLGTPVRAAESAELTQLALDMGEDPGELDEDTWAWPMLEPEAWERPIPARGAQGFWSWAPEEISAGGLL